MTRFLRWIFCLTMLTWPLSVPAQAPHLSGGLTCYLPLDGTAAPRFALGAQDVAAPGVTYAAGRVGQAAVVIKDGIAVPGAGNFSRPRGTVAFWVRIAWFPADTAGGSHTLLQSENFQVTYQADKHVLFFMTGASNPQKGYAWDYGTADYDHVLNWKPGEWHHVAVTWDSGAGRKALYLDGALISEHATGLIRSDPYREAGFVTLGGANAAGAYDELALWDRPLMAEEVGALVARPAETAQALLLSLPRRAQEMPWPVSFTLKRVEHPQATVVAPGEMYYSEFSVRNPGPQAWAGRVTYTLRDFHEEPRAVKTLPLTLGGGERREIGIPFTAPERGVFKVEARITDGGRAWTRDVSAFAAWPRPTHPPRTDSFFGNHVNSWGDDVLAQAAHLGEGWNRDHNMLQATWWPRAEPEPGVFTWNHDFQLDANKKYGMPVLGQLFGTPYWAAAGGPLPRQDGTESYPYGAAPALAAYRTYVTRTVAHDKKDIHVWEAWNEPEVSSFWNGSPEQFADLCRTAYQAAKAADPACLVLSGGYTNSAFRWHEAAARAGALRYADAISFHCYFDADAAPEDTDGAFRSVVDHWHDLTRRYGPGHPLPLWDTEGGSGDTSWLRGLDFPDLPPPGVRAPLNWRHAAAATVQADAIRQSLGIVRSFYYIQNPGGLDADSFLNLSMLDVTLAPKPKLMARVAMQAQVDGTRYAGTVRRPEGRFWAVVYQEPAKAGSLVLWWAGDRGRVRVGTRWPGRVVKAVDLMGNDRTAPRLAVVTGEPSYLYVAAPAPAVLRALRAARLVVLTPPVPRAKPVAASDKPDVPALPDYAAPKEHPAGLFTVDLRPFANMGFYDDKAGDGAGGWADEGPFDCLASMPVGRQTFYGVPFDVIEPRSNTGKTILTLRGKNATPRFPLQVVNIPLGGKPARMLYFLHSSAWGAPGTIGQYMIHYVDGQTVTAPIQIPTNNANWWGGYAPGEASRPVPVRVTNTADGKPAWRYVRVWEWQNPRPNVALRSLDFVSAGGASTPILIAVSGVR